MSVAYVAFGSNISPRLKNLQEAFKKLAQGPVTILQKSALYETKPYGGVAKGDFLNAVVKIETQLSPKDLLTFLQSIEQNMGRVREVHWGSRNIDLDLLIYDKVTLNTEFLTLPHPEMTKRSFVLFPLKDVYDKNLFGQSFDFWLEKSGNEKEVTLFKKEW